MLTVCRAFGGGDKAGEARCAGNEREAGSDFRRFGELQSDEYCAPGFNGPECQLCVEDKHLVDGDKCDECPAIGATAGRIAAVGLSLCVTCGFLAWAYSMQSWRQKRGIGPLLRLADCIVSTSVTAGLTAKIKIMVGFYQVSLVLSTTYSARLPKKYTGWTDRLAEAITVDWSGFILPTQCLPYSSRLLANTLSPLGLIALLLLAGVGRQLHRSRTMSAPRARAWSTEAAIGLLDLTPAGLFLVFCFVPSVSAAIFRAWSCQAYTISPPSEALEQVEYMRQDASVECGSPEHDSITLLAVLLLVLWPLGSLVLYTSLLAAIYEPMQAKMPNALTQATAFLHREYEVAFYWWEAIELARKLVLTGAVLLIPEDCAFLRLVMATLICSCYSVGLAAVQPYKRVEDDVLAVATSFVLLLFFLGANWTTIFLGIKERSGIDDADAILGFKNLNGVVTAMIVLIAAALLFFLAGAIIAVRRAAMVPTIRLVSSKQQPELNLALGLKWHLFNSHIWSTGQVAPHLPAPPSCGGERVTLPYLRTPSRSSRSS